MKKRIYLAGPITGLNYDQAQDWRTDVALQLNSKFVECLSPMRGKGFLKGGRTIHSGAWPNAVASQKGITRRDMFDTVNATCLFVNLKDTKNVSIGTCMEIAWAYLKQIPSIVVMEPGNIHEQHVMIQEACTYVVPTVEEAIELAKYLLNEESV